MPEQPKDRRLSIIEWLLKLFDWWSARSSKKAKDDAQNELVAEAREKSDTRVAAARGARADAERNAGRVPDDDPYLRD